MSLIDGIHSDANGKGRQWPAEVKPEIELLPEDSSNDLHFDVTGRLVIKAERLVTGFYFASD